MEWTPGKSSTQSGGATRRAEDGGGLDSTGRAKRGQAAELLDADIKAGYIRGVAGMRAPTAQGRAADEQEVTARIHDALRSAGVPLPQVVFKLIATKGVFKRRSWTLFINATRFHQGEDRVALLGTVYHEARHAEQFFDALRVAAALQPRASASTLAQWIQSRGEIVPPRSVIEVARRRPLARGESDKWFHLYFGDDAERYRKTQFDRKVLKQQLADMGEERARLVARHKMGYPITEAVRLRFNARRQRLHAEYVKADAAYRELLDEKDAHELGDSIVESLEALP